MKRFISSILLGVFLLQGISFAQMINGTPCSSDNECGGGTCNIAIPATVGVCSTASTSTTTTNTTTTNTNSTCTKDSECPNGYSCRVEGPTGSMNCVKNTEDTSNSTTTINGMTINKDCLLNGQCKFNIYDTLGIRKSVRDKGDATSVGLFVQDIVLSATMFIGTVVTIALIVSALMYIFAGASGKDPSKAKKGISTSLIGLVIVASSYFIIRLVQYLAKGF